MFRELSTMYNYESWFAESNAEPREATWTVICNFYRDLNKKVTVSQVDREEVPVILLPNESSSDVVSLNKVRPKSLSRQSSKVDSTDPLIFLTCYFFQTRKGIFMFFLVVSSFLVCTFSYKTHFAKGWIYKTKSFLDNIPIQ